MNNRNPLNILLSGCLSVLLIVLIWGLNKGFDLTDEGLYIMDLSYPEESSSLIQFHRLIAVLIGWMNLEIIGYRLLRLLLTLASSYLLCAGFWKWIRNHPSFVKNFHFKPVAVFAFITIGSFLSYSMFPQTLSYNSFTLILLQSITGLFFWFISLIHDPAKNFKSESLLILTGLLLGLVFLTKFTTGIGIFGLLFFVISLFRISQGKNVLRFVYDILLLITGIIALFLLFIVIVQPEANWLNIVRESIRNNEGHDFHQLIRMYYQNVQDTLLNGVVRFFYMPLSAFLLAHYYHRFKDKKRSVEIFTGLWAVFLVLLSFIILQQEYYKSGVNHAGAVFDAYLLLFSVMTAIALALVRKERLLPVFISRNKRDLIFVTLFLFLLPFTGAAGTNNPLLLQTAQYLFSWFLLFLLIFSFMHKRMVSLFPPVMLVILTFTATSQIIQGFVFDPYRLNGSLLEQTEKIPDLKKGQYVLFHPKMKTYIQSVNELLSNHAPDSDRSIMIALNGSPGQVYLSGGISPGRSWYKYNYSMHNCSNIRISKLKNLENLIFLVNGTIKIPGDFTSCLKENGVNYPGNYKVIGKIPHYIYNTSTYVMVSRP